LALQFVISAVLGDPTSLIAGVIGTMISKAWCKHMLCLDYYVFPLDPAVENVQVR
jgi:hypothetical protein